MLYSDWLQDYLRNAFDWIKFVLFPKVTGSKFLDVEIGIYMKYKGKFEKLKMAAVSKEEYLNVTYQTRILARKRSEKRRQKLE